MDTFVAIAVVGVWIAIAVVGLKRAFASRGPLSGPSRKHESCPAGHECTP
jgi:hypothetical protein